MTDITDRLRENSCDCQCRAKLEKEAAAEIERLRKLVAKLEDENVGLSAAVDSLYFSNQDLLDQVYGSE